LERETKHLRSHLHERETMIKELYSEIKIQEKVTRTQVAHERMNESSYDASVVDLEKKLITVMEESKRKETILSNEIAKCTEEKRKISGMLIEISSQHHALAQRHVQLQSEHAKIDGLVFKAEYDAQVSKSSERSLLVRLRRQTEEYESDRTSGGVTANKIDSLKTRLEKTEKSLKKMTTSWKEVQTESVKWRQKYEHAEHLRCQATSSTKLEEQGKKRIEREFAEQRVTMTSERLASDTDKVQLRQARDRLSAATGKKET